MKPTKTIYQTSSTALLQQPILRAHQACASRPGGRAKVPLQTAQETRFKRRDLCDLLKGSRCNRLGESDFTRRLLRQIAQLSSVYFCGVRLAHGVRLVQLLRKDLRKTPIPSISDQALGEYVLKIIGGWRRTNIP